MAENSQSNPSSVLNSETLRRPREHISNILRELQPLVNRPEIANGSAQNLASWLNADSAADRAAHQRHQESDEPSDDAIIINMMDSIDNDGMRPNSNVEQERTEQPNLQDLASRAQSIGNNAELTTLLNVAKKFVGIAIVLLFKMAFDHKIGILVIFGLVITFFHANNSIKREVAKQHKRHLGSVATITINLVMCMAFIYYVFQDKQFEYAILLVPVCNSQLQLIHMLWIVIVTDFILKFITILFKICVLVFPAKIIPYQKKGKYYLFLERTSQLYRLLAPVQPWLCYLTECYDGYEKIFSVILSAGYIISKASPLVSHMKSWKIALCKLLQPVIYGCKPSLEQMKTAGESCPICQDAYRNPTVLHCKHIFCEECVATWFDREKTCPMCRAEVADDPTWRDGTTCIFPQLF